MTPKRTLIWTWALAFVLALTGCGDSDSTTQPIDTVPPATPANLAVTGSTDGIFLSWDENSEPDLAGYVLQISLDRGRSVSIGRTPARPDGLSIYSRFGGEPYA